MVKGPTFIHPQTGKMYRINEYLTCSSAYVIYLLMCPCKLWYIGETTCEFKVRMNQHRYSIRKKRTDLPVPKHFLEFNHTEKDLKCKIIDAVPAQRRGGDRELILKKKELKCIYELNTLKPNGLNVDFKIHTVISSLHIGYCQLLPLAWRTGRRTSNEDTTIKKLFPAEEDS
ncbi:unnamed protein product, partial [Ranitomeya imitator]